MLSVRERQKRNALDHQAPQKIFRDYTSVRTGWPTTTPPPIASTLASTGPGDANEEASAEASVALVAAEPYEAIAVVMDMVAKCLATPTTRTGEGAAATGASNSFCILNS
jgi:hypothetical protein